ncbi:unnamed protein product [Peronospora belbahrii]|uniref:PH domain-containing protein n=1 Tax=Peronospora belbahrii TaxID=622444 RepID=A0AAU9KVX7_9STRA|nr:unnamed protein product [Peronospora belbahrii]CAH0520865.1 unnamed protein product [Peronospora belbahrii]
MPSRRQKHCVSLSSACGKAKSNLRSTLGNLSMLSSQPTLVSSDSLTSLSTTTSSYGGFMEDYDDVDEEIEGEECCEQGWMYWKKSDDCWLKMYARLRNELLWLSKGAHDVVAVVQIAVAGVQATEIGGIIARGPAGESMELFAYERGRTCDWIDALFVAAQLTQSYERSVAAESVEGEMTHRELREVKKVYTGTLVTYNKEQNKCPWKRRLRNACRRRLEKFVDRLDTSMR